MGTVTSQQISNYYDTYRDTEITFTKEIIRTLNLDPRQIYVKCNGAQWPCIINSTSLMTARIIIGNKSGAFQHLHEPGVAAQLRFGFKQQDGDVVCFFVATRVQSVTPYMASGDLSVITLSFTQRPPDDLIVTIGRVLEANANAIRRREERIIISDESKRHLSLQREETVVFIQNVPRNCIIRDLSFSGAKVILLGLAQFVKDKIAVLRFTFDDTQEIVDVKGKIVAADQVEGRKELVSICISFDEASVPMSYKIHINNFLTSMRKKQLDAVPQHQAEQDNQKDLSKQAHEQAKAALAQAQAGFMPNTYK